jgi:hypothetical protein
MRVAVMVVLMSVLTTPSEASKSCMTKTEARQHFGSVHIYWHGVNRCWDARPSRRYHEIHKAQQEIDQPKWYESMSEMLPDEETRRHYGSIAGSISFRSRRPSSNATPSRS